MKKIHALRLVGRRWLNRREGQTYHSVEIWVDEVCVHTVPYAYGYDQAYEETALRWLQENGYIPDLQYGNGGHEALWRYCERKNIRYNSSASNVARKKDL